VKMPANYYYYYYYYYFALHCDRPVIAE